MAATLANLSFRSPFIHHPPPTTTLPPPPPPPQHHLRSKPTTRLASLTSHAPESPTIPTPVSTSNPNRRLELELERSNRSPDHRGPPRWFSPVDAGSSRLPNSPLLLYLPGIGGSGLGLSLHHRRLGEIFDIWCLHIPVTDRTPFPELVKIVESTVKSENYQSPERPIYLVGQSFGACLALAVAARNPQIDILLVLANSATSFNGSQIRPLIPVLETVSKELDAGLGYILNLMTGIGSKLATDISKVLVAMSTEISKVQQWQQKSQRADFSVPLRCRSPF